MSMQVKDKAIIRKTLWQKFNALSVKAKCIIGAVAFVLLTLLIVFDEPLCKLLPDYIPSVSDGGSEMAVHFIDVGQGDSALIVMPTGETMLIDAGPRMSEDRLLAYLRRRGVTKLTYALFTHTHEDHIGGAEAVLRAFPTEKVILSSEETTSWFFADLLEAAEDTGAECIYASVGDVYSLGDATFTVLGPNNVKYEETNNYSIVGRLQYGDRAFLFTGDAEAEAEMEMLALHGHKSFFADVIKLGHHGSSTSSIELLWDAVAPSYAVACCGRSNDYGHPHRETVMAANKRNVTLLRTDKNGSIRFFTDGKTLSVDCDSESEK